MTGRDRLLAGLAPDLVEAIEQLVDDRVRRQLEAAGASAAPVLYSIDEAADYLRLSRRTIERLLERSELASRPIGRRVLINRGDLDAFARGERRGRSSANRSTPSLRL